MFQINPETMKLLTTMQQPQTMGQEAHQSHVMVEYDRPVNLKDTGASQPPAAEFLRPPVHFVRAASVQITTVPFHAPSKDGASYMLGWPDFWDSDIVSGGSPKYRTAISQNPKLSMAAGKPRPSRFERGEHPLGLSTIPLITSNVRPYSTYQEINKLTKARDA